MSNIRANILKYAGGTMVSQALMVAATPVLTRMFPPAQYGLLAVFTSLYGILINFSTLKFDLSVLLPKDRRTAEQLTTVAIGLSCLFSTSLLAMMLAVDLTGAWRIAWFYFLLPVAILTGAAISAAQIWLSRDKEFIHTGIGSIINVFGYVAASAILFWAANFNGALVVGYTVGMLLSAIYMCSRKAEILKEAWQGLSKSQFPRLKALFVEYRNFPLHVLPNMMLASISFQLLPILMAHFFDTATIGLYSVANRLVVLPTILAAGAVGDVFRAEFVTRLHDGGNHRGFLDKALLYLFLLVVPTYAALWLLSPFLFRIFLGENYALAGVFARYLCLGVAGNLFVQCFAYVFIALKQTRISLILQIVQAVLPLLAFLAGAYHGSIRLALLYMSATSFGMALVFIFFARRCASRYVDVLAVPAS